jgi:hypothetical protein
VRITNNLTKGKEMAEIELSNGKKAELFKGRPLPDAPKTWKKVDVFTHNIGNAYNSHLITIYKAKDGTLRYEIYRDGCFYAFYGRITIAE